MKSQISSLKLLCLALLFSSTGSVFAAGASAAFTDICTNGEEWPHPYMCENREMDLVKQRVVVSITPDAQHSGHRGAFYIGIRTDGQARANFTQNGWAGLNGGLFEPVTLHDSLPGGTQQFVVLDRGLLCPQIGGGTSELWAGYGILNEQGEMMIQNYKNYLSKGITYEHLVRTYVQHEMTENQRAWKVLEVTCPNVNGDTNN